MLATAAQEILLVELAEELVLVTEEEILETTDNLALVAQVQI